MSPSLPMKPETSRTKRTDSALIKTERTHIVESSNGQKCVILVQNYDGPEAPPMPPAPDYDGGADADSSSEGAGATSLSSVFTLCNSAIGAGVLSLPFAISEAGLVGGLLICIVIGCCEGSTLYVLSKFAERYEAASYGQLIRKALGRKLSLLLSCVLLLYLLGSCIAYMVIIGDTFTPFAGKLLGKWLGTDSWFLTREAIVMLLSVFVVLPLCLPKRLGALAPVSAAAVFGFIYTAIVICIRSYQMVSKREHPLEDVVLFRWEVRALFAIPIVTFGYNCHANVVSVFCELSDEPARLIKALPSRPAGYAALGIFSPKPHTYKMVGMLGVILSAVITIMVGYVAVGVAGYLAYPLTIAGNVLVSFPEDDVLLQIARIVIGCVVIGHFPLTHFPARRTVEDMVMQGLGLENLPLLPATLFTVLFVATCTAVSMLVTDLGQVLHLVGGSAASFMIFFLPGLLLVNAAVVKHSTTQLAALEDGPESSGSGGVNEPLLRLAVTQGIKKTGIIYSPRKSWWAGMALIVLSISILAITIFTSFVH